MPTVTNAQFLEGIFGGRWTDAHVTGFAEDPGDLETLGLRHLWGGYRWRNGRSGLDAGWNNYFVISLFRDDPKDGRSRRRKELFEATYCVVVDDVGTKVKASDVSAKWPEASWVLETSPGNYQWGYILENAEGDAGRVNALLDGMVAAGLCVDGRDPGMKGVTRYVRLPEGRNGKAKYGPGGWACVLREWEPARRFALEKLAGWWGIVLPAVGSVGAAGGVGSGRGARGSGVVPGPGNEIWDLMDRLGMIQGPSRDGEGHDCVCPWVSEHTGGVANGATVWVRSAGVYLKCHHGHCESKNWRDLQKWADEKLQEESAGLARLSVYDFPVVTGYVPPNAGARGKVAGAGTGTVLDFGTGVAGKFFEELVYVLGEDEFYDIRADGLVGRGSVDFCWRAQLRAAGVLPVIAPRTGETMRPTDWWADEANMGRARRADAVTYWPGAGRFFEDEDGRVLVNRWTGVEGLGLGVTDADVEPWLGLVRHVVGVEGPDVVELVLDWMALVVGEPGLKPGWHVVVQGGQGVGKDMIAQPLRVGVGAKNYGTANANSLHSQFNAWAEKRLIVVNELKTTTRGSATGADQYNTLKELTENTNKTIAINQKNMKVYHARNVGAYFVTSNDAKAITLEADDRRFLVVGADGVRPLDIDECMVLAEWMDARGGARLAAEWLRDRWDAMDKRRRGVLLGRAPMTRGKAKMIRATEDPVLTWVRGQIEDGAWPDLMTSDDVGRAVAAAGRSGVAGFTAGVSPHRWGSILRTLGGEKVYNGESVRLKGCGKTRVWATRAPERFRDMGGAQLAQAYVSAAGHAFSDGEPDDKVVKLTPK